MVDAGFNADNAAFIVNDQIINNSAKLDLDAEFLALGKHRVDESGAGVFLDCMTAGYRVTAMVSNGFEVYANFIAEPFIVGNGFVSDSACKVCMSDTAARFQNI